MNKYCDFIEGRAGENLLGKMLFLESVWQANMCDDWWNVMTELKENVVEIIFSLSVENPFWNKILSISHCL